MAASRIEKPLYDPDHYLTAEPIALNFCAMVQDAAQTQDRQQYPPWLAQVAPQLQGLKVGGNLVYRSETASTNDDARNLAIAGAPDGLVVLADTQTHGRGRLGRRWVSPPGGSLLLSALLRHPAPVEQAQRFTMIAGLALLDAISAVTSLHAELKWPNDVLLSGRKVAGILAESEPAGPRLRWAVVGIGVNVDIDFTPYPDLAETATSLSQEAGRAVERGPLLVALIRSLSRRYAALVAGSSPLEEWSARLATLGQQVEVESGRARFSGVAEAVTPEGALLIRLEDGSRQELLAGDVRLRSRSG